MSLAPHDERSDGRRRSVAVPGTAVRLDPLVGLLLIFGVVFLGAAFAVLSDRSAEQDLQRQRIEALQPIGSTPSVAPAGLAPTQPAHAHAADPTATSGRSSVDVPLYTRPDDPTPTATAPRSGSTAVSPTPVVTPTPRPDMPAPTRITVPAVRIDAGIIQVSSYVSQVEGVSVLKWNVADWAAGHHDTSASPGEGGNVVMAGHDDARGEVFRGLHDVKIGDDVYVTSPAGTFHYVVSEVHLRREQGAPLSERLAVGDFMDPMPVERLTLVTCWPYGVDDHRMIVIANPAPDFMQGS
jgi:sortase A